MLRYGDTHAFTYVDRILTVVDYRNSLKQVANAVEVQSCCMQILKKH
jgi:hypothetical protein